MARNRDHTDIGTAGNFAGDPNAPRTPYGHRRSGKPVPDANGHEPGTAQNAEPDRPATQGAGDAYLRAARGVGSAPQDGADGSPGAVS